MSHFTVMVIGPDPERQLKPFDENLDVPEFSKGPVSEEEKIRFYTHYSQEGQKKLGEPGINIQMTPEAFEEMYKKHGGAWNGKSWRKHTDGTWHEYSTWNPQGKWDWYSLGGRWSGRYITHLKTKPKEIKIMEIEGFSIEEVKNFIEMAQKSPSKFNRIVSKYDGKGVTIKKAIYAAIDAMNGVAASAKKGEPGVFENEPGIDQALKGDIDFDAIRKKASDEARAAYEKVHSLLIDHLGVRYTEAVREYTPWEKIREEHTRETMDDARQKYHAQDIVKAFNIINEKNEFAGVFGGGVTPYLVDKDLYIKRAVDGCFSTYAVVKDGQWYQRGEMGWFGIGSNEKDDDTWDAEVAKLLDGLPDDTLISIYDCHC